MTLTEKDKFWLIIAALIVAIYFIYEDGTALAVTLGIASVIGTALFLIL